MNTPLLISLIAAAFIVGICARGSPYLSTIWWAISAVTWLPWWSVWEDVRSKNSGSLGDGFLLVLSVFVIVCQILLVAAFGVGTVIIHHLSP